MRILLLALLLSSFGFTPAQVSQTPLVVAAKVQQQSAHRRKVSVVAKPKAILPSQKDLVSTAQSGASRPTKLPTTVATPNAAASASTIKTSTAGNMQKGHWVLFYRTPVCVPCDRLMNALSANETSGTPAAQGLTILIGNPRSSAVATRQLAEKSKVGKNSDTSSATSTVSARQQGEVNTLRSKYPALNNATWTFDTTGITDSLKPSGAPMMYGMDGNHIVWRAAGMPGGPALTQQRVSSWVSSKSSAEIIAATIATATGSRP